MFRKTIFLDSVGLCRLFQQLVGYVYFLIAFRNSKFLNDHPKVLSQVSILKVSRKREVIFVFGAVLIFLFKSGTTKKRQMGSSDMLNFFWIRAFRPNFLRFILRCFLKCHFVIWYVFYRLTFLGFLGCNFYLNFLPQLKIVLLFVKSVFFQ